MNRVVYNGTVYQRVADANSAKAAAELAEALYSALLPFESPGVGPMRWVKAQPWPRRNTSGPYFVFSGEPVRMMRDDRTVLKTRDPEWGILSDEVHAVVEAVIRQQGFEYTEGMELNRLISEYKLDKAGISVLLSLVDMNYPALTSVRVVVKAQE